MMQIQCPWCGPRNEEEYSCGGEANIERPANPEDVSDEVWAHYLFYRQNAKGFYLERWRHTFGCRQWFIISRHTVSHEISAVYLMNQHLLPEGQISTPGLRLVNENRLINR